jgi:hypothetical protein
VRSEGGCAFARFRRETKCRWAIIGSIGVMSKSLQIGYAGRRLS